MNKHKRYNTEEDRYLLQCVKDTPENITQGIKKFIVKYPERSFTSASNRYYSLIRKKRNSIFFIVSNKKSIRNRKVIRKGCKATIKKTSIWNYICNLFK